MTLKGINFAVSIESGIVFHFFRTILFWCLFTWINRWLNGLFVLHEIWGLDIASNGAWMVNLSKKEGKLTYALKVFQKYQWRFHAGFSNINRSNKWWTSFLLHSFHEVLFEQLLWEISLECQQSSPFSKYFHNFLSL